MQMWLCWKCETKTLHMKVQERGMSASVYIDNNMTCLYRWSGRSIAAGMVECVDMYAAFNLKYFKPRSNLHREPTQCMSK